MKKLIAMILSLMMLLSVVTLSQAETRTFKIGICKFVDDASLNQILDNIIERIDELEEELGITIEVIDEVCNADDALLNQIIANFIAEHVDLMIGIATPVARAMQTMTEDNPIPVVFSAISDPVGSGLVDSMEVPGGNLTGTSDFLDTGAVFNLIFAANPEIKTVALLYDQGQDASTTPIREAKALLTEKGIAYNEYTGTNVVEVQQAVDVLISDRVDAVFTPTDNTIMAAEMAIYEALAEAGIPHYTGADSFALNGAFLGYGVDYANLGRVTAEMAVDVLLGADVATMPVRTFDNGTATINTETCALLGFDYDAIAEVFAPYCIKVQPITTGVDFTDAE